MRPEDKFYDIIDHSVLNINPDTPEYLSSNSWDFESSRITRLKWSDEYSTRVLNFNTRGIYKDTRLSSVITSIHETRR